MENVEKVSLQPPVPGPWGGEARGQPGHQPAGSRPGAYLAADATVTTCTHGAVRGITAPLPTTVKV